MAGLNIHKLAHPTPKEAAKFKSAKKTHYLFGKKIAQQISQQHGTWYNVNPINTSNNSAGKKINRMPSGNFKEYLLVRTALSHMLCTLAFFARMP